MSSCKMGTCPNPLQDPPATVSFIDDQGDKQTIEVCRFHKLVAFNQTREKHTGVQRLGGFQIVSTDPDYQPETFVPEEDSEEEEANLSEEELDALTTPQTPSEEPTGDPAGEEN